MTLEQHPRYKALDHKVEPAQDGGLLHRVWLRGTVPARDLEGAVSFEHFKSSITDEQETVVVFANWLPNWVVIHGMAAQT